MEQPHGDGTAVLEICQYEVLGEAQYDDEGKCTLPPDIDPKDVVSIEDGLIVGGFLSCEDDRSFEFTKETLPDALEWLEDNGWNDDDELLVELTNAVGASATKTKAAPRPK